MKRKSSVRIAALGMLSACALAAVCAAPCVALADDVAVMATEKTETVDVTTDATGSVSKVEVSETLKNEAAAAQLLDRSELVDIKGKDDATFFINGDSIVWQADGKEIEYSGSINKELPVVVRVSYTLNGQPVSPEQLKGQSGEVVIRYDFENRYPLTETVNGVAVDMFMPFTCMTALMLDGDVFSNVKVSNGKTISDGADTIVMGYAMPGLKTSLGSMAKDSDVPEYFEVSATVRDFQLKSAMTIVTAGLMSDLNVDDMGFEDLDDTSSGLRDAMSELISGADELSSGMHELTVGAQQLKDGSSSLATGADELSEGLYLLTYGRDGKSGLNGSISSYEDLVSGLQEVDDSLSQLADSKQGIPALSAGLSAIADMYPDENTVAQLTAVITSEQSGLDPSTQQALVGLLASTQQVKKVSDGLEQASSGLTKLSEGYSEAVKEAGSLPEGMVQVVSAAKQLYSGSAELADGAHQLDDGIGQLAGGMSEAEEGTDKLGEGLETFDEEGISKIVSTIDDDLGGLKKRLRILSDEASRYDIFAGKEGATPSTVKFVFETAAIE